MRKEGQPQEEIEMVKAIARDIFLKKIAESRDEIEKIKAALDEHLGVDADNVNWAHAGSAGRLLNDLEDITAYLVLEVE